MSYDDLTVTRRLSREDALDTLYWDTYEAEDAKRRAEWEEEFDTIPYRPNVIELHQIAELAVIEAEADRAEQEAEDRFEVAMFD